MDILAASHFDVVDFNLGCPAPKVWRKGEGAALALRHDDALRAVESLVRHATTPVSVKMRILDERDPDSTVKLARFLEAAGIVALTLHGRVRRAFYSGPVHTEMIAAVRESLSIPVVANGGVFDAKSCSDLREKTGCSRVMVARGALGNPWIFNEISGIASFRPPTVSEFVGTLEEHVGGMIELYGEEPALRMARKVVLDYLKGRGFPGALRARVSTVSTRSDLDDLLRLVSQGPSDRYWQALCLHPESTARKFSCNE
jgi:tRNA-dihydrouridine synthase B